ncbi:MAG: hypothetical protein J7L26_07500 [Candidatus Aminicenantes bacterium]|nr:hypothetical protein [Candidatus Aminicenantes bacterium]
MSKKILWISRHLIHPIQVSVLKRMFGKDVKIIQDPRPFDSTEEIVRRFKEGGYDDIVVVAPLSVIHKMVELGVRPLWAEAEQVEDPSKADWNIKGRYYRFVRFRRIRQLRLEFEDLGPIAERLPE